MNLWTQISVVSWSYVSVDALWISRIVSFLYSPRVFSGTCSIGIKENYFYDLCFICSTVAEVYVEEFTASKPPRKHFYWLFCCNFIEDEKSFTWSMEVINSIFFSPFLFVFPKEDTSSNDFSIYRVRFQICLDLVSLCALTDWKKLFLLYEDNNNISYSRQRKNAQKTDVVLNNNVLLKRFMYSFEEKSFYKK